LPYLKEVRNETSSIIGNMAISEFKPCTKQGSMKLNLES